ncbi:hypothetical protein QBC45DRAFT_460021 [Copromyces sp. CBS 386.78]|nr:hypothetical protein QBC45DRAFT_460021 [Copromyces sp. CBS 386.78]
MGAASTRHPLRQPAVMGSTQTSDPTPTFQSPVTRHSASQTLLPPSPVESHESASASPKTRPHNQTKDLATPSPSPTPSATNETKPPLEIPYLGKICNICDYDFVWKKTADRCFMCLENKPSDQKIAEIFLRAMRGIDSCSNCYGEANRGNGRHCRDCHERQKLKTKKHAAKIKSRRARQAAEALLAMVEGPAQLELSQPHGVQSYDAQHYDVQHQGVQI